MRARVYSNGGNSTGGFTFNGGVMTGALLLAGNPSEALEAAAKQYVDSSLVNLNAANVTSGILPTGRLPSFTGDLIKPAGSSTINLASTGITAGDFVKPTIDVKGRVTGGASLVEADIPNMSWNKVNIDRPNTLAGYGVNNGVSLTGGILSGFISFNGAISQSMQAVTKQYIDIILSNATGISIGDIIRKPYTTTPAGFLKCNGAEVDKTTYNTLYSVIGDRFDKKPVSHSGQPWKYQYNINSEQKSDLVTWNTAGNLLANNYAATAFVTKNRVYLIGGWTSAYISNVYTALINADGTLGTWTTGTAFPFVLGYATGFVIKNKAYLVGIWNGGSSNTVHSANINSDGTIGTWSALSNFPVNLSFTQPIITNNRIYVLGGYNGSSYLPNVYSAPINADGTIGIWNTETNLPMGVAEHTCFVTKNRIYLIGGYNGTITTNTIYTALINADGTIGTWSSSTSFPISIRDTQAFVTKNRVYIVGGYNGTAPISNIYHADINVDGTIGTWKSGLNLPIPLSHSQLIVTKNKLFMLGGSNSGGITTIYSTDILGGMNDYSAYYADDKTNYLVSGSGRPWEQQYQINNSQSSNIGGWVQTSTFPATIYYHQVLVTKNRVYTLGGILNNNTSSAVYTAPINADGTLGTWSASTSLPNTLSGSQLIVTKNRVYLLGGKQDAATTVSVVYTAPINSDGTLGSWTTGTALPGNLQNSQAFVTKTRVYLCGGHNGSGYVSTVYYATINADGTLGPWFTSGVSLPNSLGEHTAVVTKNRVYMIGGYNGSGYVSTIITATINPDGSLGTWSTSGSLPVTIGVPRVFVTKNRVYLFGGYQAGGYPLNTYVAAINADGTLGAWSTGSTLVIGGSGSSIFATNSHLFIVGGSNGSAINIIQSAAILGTTNDYSVYYDGSITPTVANDDYNFTMPGNGSPWRQQYQINTAQSGDITGWSTSGNIPVSLSDSSVLVTKNRVYMLGGYSGSSFISTVYTAPINPDGTIGTWTTGSALPLAVGASQVVVTKNRAYLIGGYTGTSYFSSYYTAAINSDGTLGAWSLAGTMPDNLGASRAIITKNRIYMLGGYRSLNTPTATTYTAPIAADGTIGSWTTGTALVYARAHCQVFVTKSRVYLVGGDIDGTNGSNAIQYATINSDGTIGAWSADPSGITPTVSCGSSFITKNRAYILSNRQTSATYTATVYSAPIDDSGIIGSWSAGTSLPGIAVFASTFAVNNTLYLVGGHNTVTTLSTIFKATIASGSLNDYSAYYDGSILPVDANIVMSSTFALPDLTQDEKFDTVSYIKY